MAVLDMYGGATGELVAIIAVNMCMCIPMLHCIFGLLSFPQHFHNTHFTNDMQTHQMHKINGSCLAQWKILQLMRGNRVC